MSKIYSVSSSDSHSAEPQTVQNSAPHSIEMEQQFLGALLLNNKLFAEIQAFIASTDFFDPVHARIFESIASRIGKNMLASPVTLQPFFEKDEGLQELGGGAYLVRLAGSAVSVSAARDYAKMLCDFSLRRALIAIGDDIASKASTMAEESAPQDQIVEAEKELYELAQKGVEDEGFRPFDKVLTETINIARTAYNRDGGLVGISTGLIDLDSKLGGLHRTDLVILAGRPGMGKTALATNIGFASASRWRPVDDAAMQTENGAIVGFFSLEMSAEQLGARMLSERAGIASEYIRRGKLQESEFERLVRAAGELETCPLYIDDTPALSIGHLANRARRLKRRFGLDLLIVDYIQLMQSNRRIENRVNEISEITRGLKSIAKELDIPVLALSQLSRQVETRDSDNKRPMLADLRDSGSIEQDADVVMFVYRDEYYLAQKEPDSSNVEKITQWKQKMEEVSGKAEIIISKQRHGPTGTVEVSFDARLTRFGNLAKAQHRRDNAY